jgi:hypothetical protein
MSTIKKSLVGDYVIIRALGDEPVKLRAVAVREAVGAIDVVGADESVPMPFHLERAYYYDEELFGRMRAAFDAGQSEKLIALWEGASPICASRRTEHRRFVSRTS